MEENGKEREWNLESGMEMDGIMPLKEERWRGAVERQRAKGFIDAGRSGRAKRKRARGFIDARRSEEAIKPLQSSNSRLKVR